MQYAYFYILHIFFICIYYNELFIVIICTLILNELNTEKIMKLKHFKISNKIKRNQTEKNWKLKTKRVLLNMQLNSWKKINSKIIWIPLLFRYKHVCILDRILSFLGSLDALNRLLEKSLPWKCFILINKFLLLSKTEKICLAKKTWNILLECFRS